MGDASSRSEDLIRRAPSGYLWNQAFSLWLFFSLFLYQIVITRLLPPAEKGVYELVLTPANFAVYLAALGLESAGSVYLPRVLAEGGPRQAMAITLRLVGIRLAAVLVIAGAVIWGLPALAHLLATLAVPGSDSLARTMSHPTLLAHRVALAGYLIGVGMANLMAALLTALMRTRVVFVVGGIAQALSIALAYVLVGPLHRGADGALAAISFPAVLMAIAYIIALYRIIMARPGRLGQRMLGGMLRLGVAAWLADLANGSLIKLIAVAQLALVVSHAQIAFFGLAFEMGHAAAFLFVAGLGGVGLAAMAAAYTRRQRAHLATAWRTISKLQVVLAVPLVLFCVPHSDAIMRVVYGDAYASAGGLLALFLALNALVRVAGGGSHSAALYVLGQQNWVVVSQWGSLGVLAALDALLIPSYGAAGALLAVGLAQLSAELFMLMLARRALARPYPLPFMLRVLIALLPALVLTTLWRPASLAGLILSGAGYALLFLGCLRLMRPLDLEDKALLQYVATPLRIMLLPFVAPRGRLADTPVASGAWSAPLNMPAPSPAPPGLHPDP